jgi:hypothetical protein
LTSSFCTNTLLSTYTTPGTIPDTLLSTYTTPGTIPDTLLSTNATLDTNLYTISEAPLPQSSLRQRHCYNIPTPNLSETDNNQEEQRGSGYYCLIPSIATQYNNILPPSILSCYTQTFNTITLVYSLQLTSAKIITVLQTGNKLIRDDAFIFLKDLLPLWKGMWHQSTLKILSSNNSVTDYFVKLSRYINTLEERSVIGRIQTLLYRVLQYQYYLRILDKVKHNTENLNIKRKRSIGNATFALDYLLKHIYLNNWDLISPTEKQTRRDRLR